MRSRNLVLSLPTILSLASTFFSRETIKSNYAYGERINLSEIPKILFLMAGIMILLGGVSYIIKERNFRAVSATLLGVAMILAYFFLLH